MLASRRKSCAAKIRSAVGRSLSRGECRNRRPVGEPDGGGSRRRASSWPAEAATLRQSSRHGPDIAVTCSRPRRAALVGSIPRPADRPASNCGGLQSHRPRIAVDIDDEYVTFFAVAFSSIRAVSSNGWSLPANTHSTVTLMPLIWALSAGHLSPAAASSLGVMSRAVTSSPPSTA